MHKLIIGIVMFFSLLTLAPKTEAWYVENKFNGDPGLYGYNCGIANSPYNKCCTTFNASWEVATDVPGLGLVTGGITGAVNAVLGTLSAISQVVQPAITNWATDRDNAYCSNGSLPSGDPYDANSQCICEPPDEIAITAAVLCNQISDTAEQDQCRECMNADGADDANDTAGVWSGMGCLKVNVSAFIQETVFGLMIGIAGMAALLCIIYCAFQLQLSQNNPEKIKEAQELLTSCITGLILILFSVFILRVIGVDLLRIPGFS